MQEIVQYFQGLPPFGVLAALFAISYIENIFPPSPSDLAVVFGGTLVGVGTVGLIPALLATTLGSVTGFLTAYWVGRVFGRKILYQGRIKFIPVEAVHKVEQWFRVHGYWIIIANRFLSGTRAVVSFVAGMSEMNVYRTTIYCAISALVWNAILLIAGMLVGENWASVGNLIETYSMWVTIVLVLVAGVFFLRWRLQKRKARDADGIQ